MCHRGLMFSWRETGKRGKWDKEQTPGRCGSCGRAGSGTPPCSGRQTQGPGSGAHCDRTRVNVEGGGQWLMEESSGRRGW